MDFYKLGQYLKYAGFIIILVNIAVVSMNLPENPIADSDAKVFRTGYYTTTREEILDAHYTEVKNKYKCLYRLMGDCVGGAGVTRNFTYFAILLIVLGIIIRKSTIPPTREAKA